eukprot:m.917987 g.917987  ORF g.917987 m.917987 type:complete len:958 (-) comp60172_c0_seq30:8093-10966(-)
MAYRPLEDVLDVETGGVARSVSEQDFQSIPLAAFPNSRENSERELGVESTAFGGTSSHASSQNFMPETGSWVIDDGAISLAPVQVDDHLAEHQRSVLQTLASLRVPSVQSFKDLLPILTWLPHYNFRTHALADLIGGATIGIMMVPQSMAYALLANLPPVYGLYTSFVPLILYTAVGQSPHVSMGTFALTSLLLASAVKAIVGSNTTLDPIDVAMSLSMLVGIVQILMALCRLGFLTSYLSPPLTSGYTTASSFFIATSQVPALLGFKISSSQGFLAFFDSWHQIFRGLSGANGAAVLFSFFGIAFLYIVRFFNGGGKVVRTRESKLGLSLVWPSPTSTKLRLPIPGELLLVIFSTLISAQGNMAERYSLSIAGHVPSGLPPVQLPGSLWTVLSEDVKAVFILAIVSYAISISVGKTFAIKFGYVLFANQELFAIGAVNALSAVFSGYVSASSLSRSVLLASSGVASQLHGVVSALLVLVTMLLLAPLFESLPKASLAAIIIIALMGLFLQVRDAVVYWNTKTKDFVIWIGAFLATIIFDVALGLAVAVLLSVVVLLHDSARPYFTTLVPIPNSDLFRDVKRVVRPSPIPHVAIFRFYGSLNFANTTYFQDALYASTILDKSESAAAHPLHSIVLDASSINDLDSSAVNLLVVVFNELRIKHNCRLLLANARGPVRDVLSRSHFYAKVNKKCLFASIHDAVLFALHSSRSPDYLAIESEPGHEKDMIVRVYSGQSVPAGLQDLEVLQRDLERTKEVGDTADLLRCQLRLAQALYLSGSKAESKPLLAQSLEAATGINNVQAMGFAHFLLGRVALSSQQPQLALGHFQKYLQLSSSLDASHKDVALANLYSGNVMMLLGDAGAAVAHYKAAVDESRACKDTLTELHTSIELSRAYTVLGQAENAAYFHSRGQELWEELPRHHFEDTFGPTAPRLHSQLFDHSTRRAKRTITSSSDDEA